MTVHPRNTALGLCTAIAMLLSTLPAVAAPAPAPITGSSTGQGVFVGDQYRYPELPGLKGLLLRTPMDMAAIPSQIPYWGAGTWAIAGATAAVTALLSIPLEGGSLDVRLRRDIRDWVGQRGWGVWNKQRDFLIYAGFGGITAGLLTYGLLYRNPAYVESAVLMLEAFTVAELFHLTIKLLTGRQGTHDGEGLGAYEGPPGFFRYFPSGTPSGHVASLMALVSVLITYWANPILTITLGTFALLFAATIIADDYHYLSDVLFGGVLGYAVGRWVVGYRSSHYVGAPPLQAPQPPASSASALGAPPVLGLTLPW